MHTNRVTYSQRYLLIALTFDDPAVADEAILPNFSSLNYPDGGGDVADNRINWSFTRLLTPTVGVVVDNSWVARNWGPTNRAGFDVTNLGLKWEVYRNNPHESLISASLMRGIGNSGAQGVDAKAPDTIKPGLFFGKGFGDLPDSLSWLRPFGGTGHCARPPAWRRLNQSWHRSSRWPAWAAGDPQGRRPALGFRGRVQHALFDPLFYGRPAEGRAAQSTGTAGRV